MSCRNAVKYRPIPKKSLKPRQKSCKNNCNAFAYRPDLGMENLLPVGKMRPVSGWEEVRQFYRTK